MQVTCLAQGHSAIPRQPRLTYPRPLNPKGRAVATTPQHPACKMTYTAWIVRYRNTGGGHCQGACNTCSLSRVLGVTVWAMQSSGRNTSSLCRVLDVTCAAPCCRVIGRTEFSACWEQSPWGHSIIVNPSLSLFSLISPDSSQFRSWYFVCRFTSECKSLRKSRPLHFLLDRNTHRMHATLECFALVGL